MCEPAATKMCAVWQLLEDCATLAMEMKFLNQDMRSQGAKDENRIQLLERTINDVNLRWYDQYTGRYDKHRSSEKEEKRKMQSVIDIYQVELDRLHADYGTLVAPPSPNLPRPLGAAVLVSEGSVFCGSGELSRGRPS